MFGACNAMREGRDDAPLEGARETPNRVGIGKLMNEAHEVSLMIRTCWDCDTIPHTTMAPGGAGVDH